MAVSSHIATAVTAVELIAVLAWWFVLLAGSAILLRALQRRSTSVTRRRFRRPDRRCFRLTRPMRAAPLGAAPRFPTSSPSSPQPRSGPLCRYVDFRRRLEIASAELLGRLSGLPHDRWRMEPYPLTSERRNTLLVLGEAGVFVISATYAPGHWDEVVTVHKLAQKVGLLLPGYGGAVQAAICHPFTSAAPRVWHRPDHQGYWIAAWVLGGDHVVEWLEHFGHEHGLSRGDLERFDRLAKPSWLKTAIPSPPSWPPVPESTPPGPAG